MNISARDFGSSGATSYSIAEGTTGLIFRDGFDRADSATVGNGWVENDASFEISGSTLYDGQVIWSNVECYQNAAFMTGSSSGTYGARHGFALQGNMKTRAAGAFAAIGMFSLHSNDTSLFCGIGNVNHFELNRYVSGSSTHQDLDSTVTGTVGELYGIRMTIAQTGSNINARGLIVTSFLSASNTLDQDFVQHVALSDIPYPSAGDLFGPTKFNGAVWDEIILMGNPSGGAILVDNVPTSYSIQIGSYPEVAETASAVTFSMATWETWAFPQYTMSLLSASVEITTWKPAAGIWGGHILSINSSSTTLPTQSFLPGIGIGKEIGETNMDTVGSQWYFTSHSTSENLCLWIWKKMKPVFPGLSAVEAREVSWAGTRYEGPA